ncbi:MAG: hypothetical protein HFI17_02350 [Lachnospiraceae bacterium]|jgi:predicted peptidase|nr:hypothetical protein [Lachnospiraceae bacterium]MCI9599335.1 hypothetical protein [Lachnospiraceae bacterium]
MNKYTKLAGILAAAAMLALTGCGRQEGAEEQPEASPEESVIQTEEPEAAPEEETDQNEAASAERTEVSAEELYAKGSNDVLVYRLFTPETEEEKVPLILYLHGAGAIGDDNITHITTKDAASFVTEEMQELHPCYVLAPQLPERYTAAGESPADEQSAKGWTDEEVQEALMETIEEIAGTNGNVDMDRIYITGHSMGALGVWGMIAAYPDVFAAAVPISGLWDGSVDDLVDLPIWIFHGEKDEVVPVDRETMLRDRLEELGGNVRMTIYTDEDFAAAGVTDPHGANVPAYSDQEMFDWMFDQKRN